MAHEGAGEALERWGGIAYGVAAAAAALGDGWRVRPIVCVGRDLFGAAVDFFCTIGGVDVSALLEVDAPTNRVELLYRTPSERTERLTGGVGPWAWPDLRERVAGCDALLVNFVSGHEADLETMRHLRAGFDGPVYADLHSLFLGSRADGVRVPRRLDEPEAWVGCFDAVQMNETEARLALPQGTSREGVSLDRTLVAALEWGAALAVVTHGERGVRWATRDGLPSDPLAWRARAAEAARIEDAAVALDGARAVTGSVTISAALRGDPTGCGDVWGGAFFARLLSGDPIGAAAETATRFAARNVAHRGADGLYKALLHEVAS